MRPGFAYIRPWMLLVPGLNVPVAAYYGWVLVSGPWTP